MSCEVALPDDLYVHMYRGMQLLEPKLDSTYNYVVQNIELECISSIPSMITILKKLLCQHGLAVHSLLLSSEARVWPLASLGVLIKTVVSR